MSPATAGDRPGGEPGSLSGPPGIAGRAMRLHRPSRRFSPKRPGPSCWRRNGLRDEDREIIAARYFLDLSEAEAAEALDLPRGTVKSRLSRALGGCARGSRARTEGRAVAEARRRLSAFDDEALGVRSGSWRRDRDAGRAADRPPRFAARARARIEASGTESRHGRAGGWFGTGRSTTAPAEPRLAVAALLVLAAVAGAVTAWLPGIRIIFGDGPSPSPSGEASPSGAVGSSLGPIGMTLGLGTSVPLDEAERLAGVDLVLPPDPAIGPPDAVFVNAGRVSLVWAARPGLPAAGPTGSGC